MELLWNLEGRGQEILGAVPLVVVNLAMSFLFYILCQT